MAAENLPTYANQEFGFSFQYPAQWVVSPPCTPNSRAKVVSPVNTPHAECAVIVQRYPQATDVSQRNIDQLFSEAPSSSEFRSALSQSHNDVEIVAVSIGTLHSRPAHLARVRYSVGTRSASAFVSGRMVMTATPGLTWTLSCGGQGNTLADAERSFQYWQLEINRIVSSFRFR